MSKYNEELVEEVLKMVEADFYTITEICRMLGISRKTFYMWKESRPEFREALNDAMKLRDQKLLMIARTSLKQRLEGYTVTEERYNYVPAKSNPNEMILKSKTVKKKHCAPDMNAIKFMMNKTGIENEGEEKPEVQPFVIVVPHEACAESLREFHRNQKGIEPTPDKGESECITRTIDCYVDVDTGEVRSVVPEGEDCTGKTIRQIELKRDPKTNVTIVKGGSEDFVPPGYLLRG